MSRLRRLLWWIHHRYAHESWIVDATGDSGDRVVWVSIVPHVSAGMTPEEADTLADALRYQARAARGEVPSRRLDYREDR